MPLPPKARRPAAHAALLTLTGVSALLLAAPSALVASGPATAYFDSIVAAAPTPPELAAAPAEVPAPPDLAPTVASFGSGAPAAASSSDIPASAAASEDLAAPIPDVVAASATLIEADVPRCAAPDGDGSSWTETGEASWYGPYFHGRAAASGERFDGSAWTIAHPSLPFGAVVAIENLANGKSVLARVNDRGPFVAGRILDCSYRVAHDLGFVGTGVATVRITWIDCAPPDAFAGTGTLVALCEEDREPLARYAAAFLSGSRRSRGFVGPPEPPLDLALATAPEPVDETLAVRRASVVSFSAVVHAGRHLMRALFGHYADAPVDLRLPARLDGFGLRAFVGLFLR